MSSKRCAAANCDCTTHLCKWPEHKNSTAEQRRLWTKFVTTRVKNFEWTKSARLCYKHFTPDAFVNWQQYVMMKDQKVKYVVLGFYFPTMHQVFINILVSLVIVNKIFVETLVGIFTVNINISL